MKGGAGPRDLWTWWLWVGVVAIIYMICSYAIWCSLTSMWSLVASRFLGDALADAGYAEPVNLRTDLPSFIGIAAIFAPTAHLVISQAILTLKTLRQRRT